MTACEYMRRIIDYDGTAHRAEVGAALVGLGRARATSITCSGWSEAGARCCGPRLRVATGDAWPWTGEVRELPRPDVRNWFPRSCLNLLGLRDYAAGQDDLIGFKGVQMLHAYGGGGTANLRPGTEVAQPKTDTKIRKALELDWPSQPEKIWGVELWGYAVGADLGLVNKALSTPPHPGCQVVGSLETSWYVPRLLLKV